MLTLAIVASTRKTHHLLQLRSPLCTVPTPSSDFNQLKKLGHRDWLAPNEVLTIIRNLKDPNSVVVVLNQYSKRKDYRPNEALYSLSIDILAQAKMFDAIEDVMGRLRAEKSCRLSDAFFYIVIKIYGNMAGRVNRAVETLFDMPTRYSVFPSIKSFNFVLNLLVVSKMYDVVHEVYMAAPRLGVEIDSCCLNILVKGLCESGNVSYAHQLLDEFPKQRCSPNVRTFSTLMHGLIEQGKMEDAFGVLDRMEKEGVYPDTITFNILISGLRKKGRVEEGVELLERMKLKGCDPNDGSYQEVLYGLLEKNQFMEATGLMAQMLSKRMNPSFRAYKLAISGLCKNNSFDEVDWILKQMMYQDFVPKMGMWKTIVRNLFSDRARLKEIVGDSLLRVLGEGQLGSSEVEPEERLLA